VSGDIVTACTMIKESLAMAKHQLLVIKALLD